MVSLFYLIIWTMTESRTDGRLNAFPRHFSICTSFVWTAPPTWRKDPTSDEQHGPGVPRSIIWTYMTESRNDGHFPWSFSICTSFFWTTSPTWRKDTANNTILVYRGVSYKLKWRKAEVMAIFPFVLLLYFFCVDRRQPWRKDPTKNTILAYRTVSYELKWRKAEIFPAIFPFVLLMSGPRRQPDGRTRRTTLSWCTAQ